MITLGWPGLLLLAPLPWLFRMLLPPEKTNGDMRAPLVERALHIQTLPQLSPKRQNNRSFILIWLLLMLAAVRPQWLSQNELVVSGRDLILAVDISASMSFPDLDTTNQISRLELVKRIGGEFIEQRKGDRLGLVLFATAAYRQTPLTYDTQAIRRLLEEAKVGFLGRETAIGDAIGLVVSQLVANDSAESDKVLILISDGASNSGKIDPLKAAEMAAGINLKIYTVGLGADKMMARTPQGITKINPSQGLDEVLLAKLAKITDGQYFRIKDREDLSQLRELLNYHEPNVYSQPGMRPLIELFYWPLAMALVLSFYGAWSWLRRVSLLEVR